MTAAPTRKTVTLADEVLPSLGQGTWYMGEGRHPPAQEADALRLGLDLGLRVIDTAEMYADGGAESVVGQALRGRRDDAFVVSKVLPHNASTRGVREACARSLKRMGIETIDLYLLHWRGNVPLAETVEAFERLREAGQIRHWGVSNFDADDLDALAALPSGGGCAANQVLYNLEARGIEYDLLPRMRRDGMALMAYSPVGQAGHLLRHPVLRQVAETRHVSAAQVVLAWTLRAPGVLSIPKATDPAHLRENAAAWSLSLTDDDLALLDSAFAPPRRKQPLAML